tara:strand:+ start:4265 stop:6169 length:1905 start_codon:yes stop_codon:yes gene_type:complete
VKIQKKHIQSQNTFQSVFRITNRGAGYVFNPNTNERYFVSRRSVNSALDGDYVKVMIYKYGVSYTKVKVVEIINRSGNNFICRLFRNRNQIFASLYPHQSKKIILKNLDRETNELDLAEIEIIDWREGKRSAYANMVRVIRGYNDNVSDYEFIVHKYGINELGKLIQTKSLHNYQDVLDASSINREDLTHLKTFTIDPANAKDYDDAISIQCKNNEIDLFVHIADVSSYVRVDDENDRVAKIRGNSYYFDRGTFHMLPKILSTNFCSLKPNEKRFALTVCINFDEHFEVTNYRFFDSLIISDKKFNYQEAENVLQNKIDDPFYDELVFLLDLTTSLKKKRLSQNGFDMNYKEKTFVQNKNGVAIDVQNMDKLKSHQIVEECMLLANKLASKYILKKYRNNSSMSVQRNHEAPSQKNTEFLQILMSNHGSNHKMKNPVQAKDIHSFLCANRDNSNYDALCVLVMQKMQKANYASKCLGHYGLGFKNYTHFTSPIRRYSDLVVHRIIKGEKLEDHYIIDSINHCNEGEIRSQQSEREYHILKSLRFLKGKESSVLRGCVMQLKSSRVVVAESRTGIHGAITRKFFPRGKPIISNDKFVMKWTGEKKRIEVGQEILLRIESINVIDQEIYFRFHEPK